MREMRAISFTDRELTSALVQFAGRLRRQLPSGTLEDTRIDLGPPVRITLPVRDDYGEVRTLSFEETEVAAALVQFCMDRKVRLPARGEKVLKIIAGQPTLVIWLPDVVPPPRKSLQRPVRRP
ncbi:hypothetical protein [Rhodospirillum centenum]|uniref:Uncharacterized protein n=1 Tax=Rhodospirillum centenum (strain ATCC 51521 / SW) TaxID=414684 RepID=B6ITF3_RHOCS|nr:hypothetical protein [Rhodospirillum centenum]ACI99171.1 hypothetical protein RC1_1774 [Rhodospirillum centenum SW]